jgi:hypothetical protein
VWVVGTGRRQDERGPFVLLHYNGTRWQRVALLSRYGDPVQVVPDGSGGLWIPTIAGVPGEFTMLHYSGGHLLAARMPLPPSEITVFALAHVAGTTVTFGGGDSHAAFEPGNSSAIILRYAG